MKVCPIANNCSVKFKHGEGHCDVHKGNYLCKAKVGRCPICKDTKDKPQNPNMPRLPGI